MRHAISKYPGSKAKNFNKNNKGRGGGGGFLLRVNQNTQSVGDSQLGHAR